MNKNKDATWKTDYDFTFPEDFEESIKLFRSTERIESTLGIEFSCGDGLFLSDLEEKPELLEKYDGKVDVNLVRRKGKLMKEFKVFLVHDASPDAKEEFSKIKIVEINSKPKNRY